MPITPEDLHANPEVVAQLAELCDVELHSGDPEPPLFIVEGATDLQVFARDGTGGQFALASASQRIFYFSSEGEAAVVADDFDAFIRLVVHLPYWQDLLKYSAHGSLAEMRRAAPVLEAYWSDEDVVGSREFLREQLRLGEPGDVVGALHKAVSTVVDIRDPYGGKTESPFGRFTIDDNPMLRLASE